MYLTGGKPTLSCRSIGSRPMTAEADKMTAVQMQIFHIYGSSFSPTWQSCHFLRQPTTGLSGETTNRVGTAVCLFNYCISFLELSISSYKLASIH
jgi:hypothetical protein